VSEHRQEIERNNETLRALHSNGASTARSNSTWEQPEDNLPPLTKAESAWLVMVNDLRNAYPTSDIAKISFLEIEDIARSWARILAAVPIERISDVYHATVIGSKYPPTPADFAETWATIFSDEQRVEKQGEWKRHDENVRALPVPTDGPGLRVHALLTARKGNAIVCNCPPKNGYEWPARLTADGAGWECQQRTSCGFWLPVEDMPDARVPENRGRVGLESETVAKFKPQEPKGLSMAADDCNVSLDAMTPQQYMDFKNFYKWWREHYECRLSPELLAEHWPKYAATHKTLTAPEKL
jgi:hypothetical protein